MAESIACTYESFANLMRQYTSKDTSVEEKKKFVQTLPASGKRTIGPSISKRLYHYFTSSDGTEGIQ